MASATSSATSRTFILLAPGVVDAVPEHGVAERAGDRDGAFGRSLVVADRAWLVVAVGGGREGHFRVGGVRQRQRGFVDAVVVDARADGLLHPHAPAARAAAEALAAAALHLDHFEAGDGAPTPRAGRRTRRCAGRGSRGRGR